VASLEEKGNDGGACNNSDDDDIFVDHHRQMGQMWSEENAGWLYFMIK